MSGQRVRCADSGAGWATTVVAGDDPTHSERRQAHLKAEVCYTVLNVLSGQTFTQRPGPAPWRRLLRTPVENIREAHAC